jgi:hypothetical protein
VFVDTFRGIYIAKIASGYHNRRPRLDDTRSVQLPFWDKTLRVRIPLDPLFRSLAQLPDSQETKRISNEKGEKV